VGRAHTATVKPEPHLKPARTPGRGNGLVTARAAYGWATRAACALLAAAVSGCGLSIDIGPNDDPPNVSLAAAPSEGSPGERIGLVAAASDDYVVREVLFFRIDSGGNTLLGRDSSAPYALETLLPAGVAGQARYVARAVDDAGQEGESGVVVVTIK
jgi:hypothetical protein